MTISARSQSVDDTLESGVIRKLMWRIIPFIIACYFMSFLNRVNIGFAALTMNKDLGLTSEMFGVGAGIFFVGYILFGVPSNLLLNRIGARRLVSVMMVAWGVVRCRLLLPSQCTRNESEPA
jgi:MFS transporter, ACS family, tartrate transporter